MYRPSALATGPEELLPASIDALFLHIPYEKRWESLKSVIVPLFLGTYDAQGRQWTIPRVAEFMKQHYHFDATPHQYSYRFRQWDLRKRIVASEKDDLISSLGRRKHAGISKVPVTLAQGEGSRPFDPKRLKRYIQEQARRRESVALKPGVFSSWGLPYAAFAASLQRRPDQPSPFGTAKVTPSNITVHSPEAVTPGRLAAAGSSPDTQMIRQKDLYVRASLFLEGRTKELLVRCNNEDRRSIVNQLHDFHIQCFVTAKYWGKGPRVWTPGLVSAFTHGSLDLSASPPSAPGTASSFLVGDARSSEMRFRVPTDLCRWTIHVPPVRYVAIPEPNTRGPEPEGYDLENPNTWPDWNRKDFEDRSYPDTMRESITNASFLANPSGSEPLLSAELVSTTLHESSESLLADSIKFAIMAGNIDLLQQLLSDFGPSWDQIRDIHPVHLAASFLDGGRTCCDILAELCAYCTSDIKYHDTDDLGYTLVDRLVLNIIRSHTDVAPERLNRQADIPNRFPGEEKDICGRWDPDTPAVRQLFAAGYARIPTSWKHPFCHTAAQAICHAAIIIYAAPYSPDINKQSGLFSRNCFECGQRLSLRPLHLMVVVAFYLAERGMAGENLFGVLAFTVCLISLGADPTQEGNFSMGDILGDAQLQACTHQEFTPGELMQAVPTSTTGKWSQECQTGWSCLSLVMRLATSELDDSIDRVSQTAPTPSERDPNDDMDIWGFEQAHDSLELGHGLEYLAKEGSETSRTSPDSSCELIDFDGINVHEEWLSIPCTGPKFGLIWACIQTELLTYRRLSHGDSWLSSKFSMDSLRSWLQGESESFRTPLVDGNMMKRHSRCGWFNCGDFILPVADEVCGEYFMNMEDFERTGFVSRAELLEEWIQIACEVT